MNATRLRSPSTSLVSAFPLLQESEKFDVRADSRLGVRRPLFIRQGARASCCSRNRSCSPSQCVTPTQSHGHGFGANAQTTGRRHRGVTLYDPPAVKHRTTFQRWRSEGVTLPLSSPRAPYHALCLDLFRLKHSWTKHSSSLSHFSRTDNQGQF